MSTVPHYRRKEAMCRQSRTTDVRRQYYVDSPALDERRQ